MTVIVTDGRLMACDGLITDHDTIVGTKRNKIRRMRDGSLVGTAGDSLVGGLIQDWLDTPVRKRGNYPESETTRALQLMRDGSVLLYDPKSNGNPISVSTPAAIGSGMDYALAAMDMGATVARAVGIAIGRNPYCGGAVFVEAIA